MMTVTDAYDALRKVRPGRSFQIGMTLWHHDLGGEPMVRPRWWYWDAECRHQIESEHLATLVGEVRIWAASLPTPPENPYAAALAEMDESLKEIPNAVG